MASWPRSARWRRKSAGRCRSPLRCAGNARARRTLCRPGVAQTATPCGKGLGS
ncbi:hypothetical protein [Azotobacter beijerinckii]|uniref:hypothetical protein n=1 Tax=Azotobacter beijerinckii TaxID=170623 RepID=UPI00349E9C1B